MTGWGQTGPLAHAAGHDLNYIALTGLLGFVQRTASQAPSLPPTMLGDATGALGLAFGIAAAALHARATGHGCVIDAAMVDITAMLGALVHITTASGALGRNPAAPLEHSVFHGSPFYDTYACQDGRFVSICALEPPFYALLLQKLGFTDVDATQQFNARLWPDLKTRMLQTFDAKPMAHWVAELEGSDVCFAPVLTLAEAAAHPHMAARGVYAQHSLEGRPYTQAQAAPRFFRI